MYFQAAILEKLNTPFFIHKLEIPRDLSVGQVLVRVYYSGICGAQLNEQTGVKGNDKYLPHTVGHEGGCKVVATGPGVRNVRPGDHAVIHWRKGIGIDAQFPQYWCPELNKYVGGGAATTWNEYAAVSENRLTKINKDIPLDIAALLGCAVTTGLGVCSNDVNIHIGESVLVTGCGGVGLNVLQGASLGGAYPIIGLDINESKLRQALIFGATHVINSHGKSLSDLVAEVKKIVGSAGVDNTIDTTGRPEVIEFGWETVHASGVLCLVGQIKHDQQLALQTLPMHQGKTIIGSDGGKTNPTVDIPRYLRLLQAGRLNLRGLITHETSLQDINTTLDLIRSGKANRCIIKMN